MSTVAGILFVASLATLVQSYVLIKLGLLAVFLATSVNGAGRRLLTYRRLIWFYAVTSIVGIAWTLVGLKNGYSTVAATDAFRLRVVWSLAFLVIYSLLRSRGSLRTLHWAFVLSGILISVINLSGLVDSALDLNLISANVRKELELFVGFHDGYIQITSNNIGALFVILPYLVALQFRADAARENSGVAKLSLALCLVTTAASGRRALWLVAALTPGLILLLSYCAKSLYLLRRGAKRAVAAYAVAAVLGGALIAGNSIGGETIWEPGFIRHFQAAFSAEDARSAQKGYLVDAFLKSPVFGSGFGGYAAVLRSEERPWTYELTYYQMLFNLGITGAATLAGLFSVYLIFVVKLLRRYKEGSAVPFGFLVAFCALLIGSFSNPYLGSFDYLFFVGLLPYVSTFRRGFEDPVTGPVQQPSLAAGWVPKEGL